MENLIKRCPYDGKKFIPKRSNQIFSCDKNRIAFHNKKYKNLRQKLNKINNLLFNNYMIIKKIINDKNEIQVNDNFLRGQGYNFKYLTHIVTNNTNSFYGLYEYAFYKVNNNETKFFLYENN